MTKERQVWWNGEFIPESEARISIYSHGLQNGDSVFTMLRSFNKELFKVDEHLKRLYTSIEVLQIPVKESVEDMKKIIDATVAENADLLSDNDEFRVLVHVDRGLPGLYEARVDIPAGPIVAVSVFPLKWTVSSFAPLYGEGINLHTPSQRQIPARYLDPKMKNRSRLHYQMANIQTSRIEGKNNWSVLLDDDGFITEGPGYNFFMIYNGGLYTPEPRNVLKGVSRQYVLDLCDELDIEWREDNIEPYDVYQAEEAFVTATPFCILPVFTFNGSKIGDGKFGQVTQKLLDRWSNNVGVDIVEQIKGYYEERETTAPSVYGFKKKK